MASVVWIELGLRRQLYRMRPISSCLASATTNSNPSWPLSAWSSLFSSWVSTTVWFSSVYLCLHLYWRLHLCPCHPQAWPFQYSPGPCFVPHPLGTKRLNLCCLHPFPHQPSPSLQSLEFKYSQTPPSTLPGWLSQYGATVSWVLFSITWTHFIGHVSLLRVWLPATLVWCASSKSGCLPMGMCGAQQWCVYL